MTTGFENAESRSRRKSQDKKAATVADLLHLISSTEKIASSPLFGRSTMASQFDELKRVLLPLKTMAMPEFIELLSSSIGSLSVQTVKSASSIAPLEYTNEEIRSICENPKAVDKASLVKIGHVRFGISEGLLRSSSKAKISALILSSLDNLDIFDSIANKARN